MFYTCILFESSGLIRTHSIESLRVLTTPLHHPYTFLLRSYMPRALLLYAPRHGGVWAMAHSLAQNIIALDKTLCHLHQRLNLKPHIFNIRLRIPFEFNKWLGNAFSFHIRLTSSKSVHNFRSYRLSRYALYRSLITSLAGFEPATFGSTILHLASAPSRHWWEADLHLCILCIIVEGVGTSNK